MSKSFSDLESPIYIKTLAPGLSILSDWYLEVRKIPIDELGVEDIARAVRQELFLTNVLPAAFAMLAKDVTVGDLYDGQLLYALSALNEEQLKKAPDLNGIFHSLNSISVEGLSSELKNELLKLIDVVSRALSNSKRDT